MRSVEREVRGEIMRTDIFVKLVSATRGEAELNRDLDDAFASFRDVSRRFSRFREDSELSRLNASSETRVSSDLAALLAEAIGLHRETDGVFDPSVLVALESEGYAGSFGGETFGIPSGRTEEERHAFTELNVDAGSGTVRKPKGLRMDLGGIAKGFAVDRVARMLRERGNGDFLIDAGGDIYASGCDIERSYGYWAIDIAPPAGMAMRPILLMLRDMAVATSGTDRRRWMVEGEARHHLIDPRTGKSAVTDIVSATVVGESVVRAEVLAKTLCMLGQEQALSFAEERRIAAFLVTESGKTVYNRHMKPYVFVETN